MSKIIAHYIVHCDRCKKKFKVEQDPQTQSQAALSGHIVGTGGIDYEFKYDDLCPKCQLLVNKLYGKLKDKKVAGQIAQPKPESKLRI